MQRRHPRYHLIAGWNGSVAVTFGRSTEQTTTAEDLPARDSAERAASTESGQPFVLWADHVLPYATAVAQTRFLP